jgi:hypothetical protein
MQSRILDLDGSVVAQPGIAARARSEDLIGWGPLIRLACRFGRFRRFEAELADRLGGTADDRPVVTFFGSGDFHHVSLALLRRQPAPFNLLIVDKHPDWVGGVPFLHCGTWVAHALRLPNLRRVFHVGGMLDFDNYYRPFAPWPDLRSRRVVALPAVRRFRGGGWNSVESLPIRPRPETPIDRDRLDRLVEPFRADLGRAPLYISVDKDVLTADVAAVNWDSGSLGLDELRDILAAFLEASGGHLAGVDCTGDWSPVSIQNPLASLLGRIEHPRLEVDPGEAASRNEQVNTAILNVFS